MSRRFSEQLAKSRHCSGVLSGLGGGTRGRNGDGKLALVCGSKV